MRVSLDGKGQAVDGDLTTTGATCIGTDAGCFSGGRMVLREGDATTPCPLCGEVGRVPLLHFRWPTRGDGRGIGGLRVP